MDELDRAVQNASRMREARKRLNEMKENIAAWAGGGLRIKRSDTENASDRESVTDPDVTEDDTSIASR